MSGSEFEVYNHSRWKMIHFFHKVLMRFIIDHSFNKRVEVFYDEAHGL